MQAWLAGVIVVIVIIVIIAIAISIVTVLTAIIPNTDLKHIRIGLLLHQPFPEDIRMLLDDVHMNRVRCAVQLEDHVTGHLVLVHGQELLRAAVQRKLDLTSTVGNVRRHVGRWGEYEGH